MSIPPSNPELSPPTDQLAIQSKVLGYPGDRQWNATKLSLTELDVESTSEPSESKSTLPPRIGPPVSIVVPYPLSREGPVLPVWMFGVFFLHTKALRQGLFQQGDVDATKADVQSNVGFNLLGNAGGEDVGLVGRPHAPLGRIPLVTEITFQYNGPDEKGQ